MMDWKSASFLVACLGLLVHSIKGASVVLSDASNSIRENDTAEPCSESLSKLTADLTTGSVIPICPESKGEKISIVITAFWAKTCQPIPQAEVKLEQTDGCKARLAAGKDGILRIETHLEPRSEVLAGSIEVKYQDGIASVPFQVDLKDKTAPYLFHLRFPFPENGEDLQVETPADSNDAARQKRSLGLSTTYRFYPSDKRKWTKSGMRWIKRASPQVADEVYDPQISMNDILDGAYQQNPLYNEISRKKRSLSEEKKMSGIVDDVNGVEALKHALSDESKRKWAKSGMQWIKRNDEGDAGDKRSWAKSGMRWIKRADDDNEDDEDDGRYSHLRIPDRWKSISGMNWMKRAEDDLSEADKRSKWAKSGMRWIKRDDEGAEADKRGKWANSGMKWIKRDDDDAGDGDDEKRSSWQKSGMRWIKRDDEDDAEKRGNWADSGMKWIKREDGDDGDSEEDVDKRGSWADSGMKWIKRQDLADNKRKWAKSGMQWIKRYNADDALKRNWAKSGMQWIRKRDGPWVNYSSMPGSDELSDKRGSWANSGMRWIRSPWTNSGMKWI